MWLRATASSTFVSGSERVFPTVKMPGNRLDDAPPDIKLPFYATSLLPMNIRSYLQDACKAAVYANRGMRVLKDYSADRFHFLCPTNNLYKFRRHIDSVDRLLEWKPKNMFNLILAQPVKMPRFSFDFYVDEEAYEDYVWDYETKRIDLINGCLASWTKTKLAFEQALEFSGMSSCDKEVVKDWWMQYSNRLQSNYNLAENMEAPTFDNCVAEFHAMIEERIETDPFGFSFHSN